MVAVVLPRFGWRAVFFVGVLPALVVFWIRRDVPESALWLERRSGEARAPLRAAARGPTCCATAPLATAMNACSMFGYWGLFTWIPAYLSLPVAEGGRGLDLMKTTTWLVVMGVGKWLGYILFGFAADAFGRRRAYVAYLLAAAALVPLYGLADATRHAARCSVRWSPSSAPATSPASPRSPPSCSRPRSAPPPWA